MPKIYYLIPDLPLKTRFSKRAFFGSIVRRDAYRYLKGCIISRHNAVGGIKVMYQHCMMLSRIGFDVTPLLLGEYSGNRFGFDLKPINLAELDSGVKDGDIVVGTEFSPYDALNFPNAIKIIFVQNWINIKIRLKSEDKSKSYLELGYDGVITCSKFCTDKVYDDMGISSTTITNGIDMEMFTSNPKKRIPGRVLVLSRKKFADFKKIELLVGEDVEFRVVDGLTQSQLIEEYQKADIFLAMGYPEGFSLPPLEAMCCGCAVVGFTGGGANEFMIHNQTALVAPDGYTELAAEYLIEILNDEIKKERLRKAGQKIAKNYTLENTAQQLKAFYSKLIG